MLHVPINTVLAVPNVWRQLINVPRPTTHDWSLLTGMRLTHEEQGTMVDHALGEVQRLSFYPSLETRVLAEAATFTHAGFDSLMIENVAAPYFVRGQQPPVIYWVMRALSERLRAEYPDITIGVQILAYSDDWAMDIACRSGLDFIRCESALFEGVRPEGRTPNQGNLAKLYMARSQLMAELGKAGEGPQVYVDVQKKHTVFASAFDSLDLWLENILFQKLEGIVITGKATGQQVKESDLRQAREAIEKAKTESLTAVGVEWSPHLIVGSGASIENIPMCKRYADAVIVGSALKKNGFWENPLDEERVKRFMEAWSHRA